MKKILLSFLLCVAVVVCFADEYKDTVYNVIYTYNPSGSRAEVKRGEHFYYDEDDEYEVLIPGSPDAKDEIIILDRFTINGKEYIVDEIGCCAFLAKRNIVSVYIPSSIKNIESQAFYGCTQLSNVIMEEGVTSINNLAFCQCKSLKTISLPEGLETINAGAFNDTGLTSITIPSTVQSLGDAIFFFSPIHTITSLMNEPFPIRPICREQNKVTLRVPVGTKSKYEMTSGWNQFLTIEEIQPTGIISPKSFNQIFDYDLQGRKMLYGVWKGVYIQNDKKVVSK